VAQCSGFSLCGRAGNAEFVSYWIGQNDPAAVVGSAVVVQNLRAQRQEPVDLRIAVLVGRLEADMYTVLDGLVLGNGLEVQPGPARRLDDDLGVARNEIWVYGVADHLAPNCARASGSEQSKETFRMKDTMTEQHRDIDRRPMLVVHSHAARCASFPARPVSEKADGLVRR
jgi:hypothetical protein